MRQFLCCLRGEVLRSGGKLDDDEIDWVAEREPSVTLRGRWVRVRLCRLR